MSRRLRLVLADAFERAAHDIAMAEQVHHHHNDTAPAWHENLTYWCRGFSLDWLTNIGLRLCQQELASLSGEPSPTPAQEFIADGYNHVDPCRPV